MKDDRVEVGYETEHTSLRFDRRGREVKQTNKTGERSAKQYCEWK